MLVRSTNKKAQQILYFQVKISRFRDTSVKTKIANASRPSVHCYPGLPQTPAPLTELPNAGLPHPSSQDPSSHDLNYVIRATLIPCHLIQSFLIWIAGSELTVQSSFNRTSLTRVPLTRHLSSGVSTSPAPGRTCMT